MAQTQAQKMAFAKILASKKGKSGKQVDPTKPFPAPPTKKKAVGKVDVVLTKGVAPKKKVVKKVNAKK